MVEALIGLGANLGDARATLAAATRLLCDGQVIKLIARSADFRTPPWGVVDQPAFVNACLRIETSLSPRELLGRALACEAALGRERAKSARWGPRAIDIDILAFDGLSIEEPDLQIPHPRAFERAFVLAPLSEIAPDWRLGARTVREWAALADATGIVRLPPLA